MPKKKQAKTSSRPLRKKAKKTPRARAAVDAPPPGDPRFVRDLLVRGEAASLTPDGTLPQNATHVITGGAADTATVKRARFKAF